MSDTWFADDQWHYVSSSNIDAFKYSPLDRTLSIRFHGAREYEYFNIPLDMVEGLATATSPGQWFHQNLKGAPFQRLS